MSQDDHIRTMDSALDRHMAGAYRETIRAALPALRGLMAAYIASEPDTPDGWRRKMATLQEAQAALDSLAFIAKEETQNHD